MKDLTLEDFDAVTFNEIKQSHPSLQEKTAMVDKTGKFFHTNFELDNSNEQSKNFLKNNKVRLIAFNSKGYVRHYYYYVEDSKA